MIAASENKEINEDTKYKINLYNLYITKKLYQNALDLINAIQSKNLSLIQVNQDKAYILYLLKKYDESINQCYQILKIEDYEKKSIKISSGKKKHGLLKFS